MRYLTYILLYIILYIVYNVILHQIGHTYSMHLYILVIPHPIFWLLVLYYEYLDKYYSDHPKKIANHDKNINIYKVIKITIRNQIINIAVMYHYIYCFVDTQAKTSIIFDIVHIILHVLCYDVIFYTLHMMMHVPILANIHKLHHSTLATRGITALYMNIFDFMLEAVIPVYLAGYIIMKLIGVSTVGLVIFSTFGYIQTVVTHSGWDLPYLPSPKSHYIHHTKLKMNYSSEMMDSLFGTNK